ncbi:MAG: 30S ribosomal protein S5 [Candidatus Omnitrophota bacterium]
MEDNNLKAGAPAPDNNASKPAPKVGMQSVEKAEKKLAYSSDIVPGGSGSAPTGGGRDRDSGGRGRGGKKGQRPPREKEESSGLIEKVIRISRVAKVTKGGTKLSFTALVVVGDAKGRAGYSLGKAAEVAIAIKKGMNAAKKCMVEVNVYGTTVPHEALGSWCATRVLLKPAADGTGVIAAGPVRAICDGVGIKNILTKVHRSSNPLNVVKATFDGLAQMKKRPAKVTV